MTVSINKSKEAFEYFKRKIAAIKDNDHLTLEGKAAALKEIKAELDEQLTFWRNEVAQKRKQLAKEGETPTLSAVNRKLDSEITFVLSYQARIIQSRLAAEGDSLGGFKAVMDDFVKNGNDTTRQAFLDSFHEVKRITDSFEHHGKMGLKDYYNKAKELMKTPEEIAHEEAKNKAISEAISLRRELETVESNVAVLKASISSVEFAGKTGW